MTRVKLELDTETARRLVEAAVAERRPANLQAEVILMRALGVPPPEVRAATSARPAPASVDSRTVEVNGAAA